MVVLEAGVLSQGGWPIGAIKIMGNSGDGLRKNVAVNSVNLLVRPDVRRLCPTGGARLLLALVKQSALLRWIAGLRVR